MLTLEQIEQQYPERLRVFKRNILREYVQYKILGILFALPVASKLSFLGGTALRMIYENTRFSEDLDFDNFGLTQEEFFEIAQAMKVGMEREGFGVEINTSMKSAFR